ncbi:1-deoxy-D-xylulose-5-phosphate synthase [Candidatus Woesearchaeota archaeon]|nr:1-deoxy-D-xylulose-5-phosphate synthase [Candidatus Woesearchaeota archaeon]
MNSNKPLKKLLSSKKSQSSLFGQQIADEVQVNGVKTTSLLDTINSPKELKRLSREQLKILAREIREKILEVVSKNGGHLGGPLGAVELTLAVHYVYDAPCDKIVIDTGHQSYPHKLVTGRRDNFHTLRQYKGVCGFCNIAESEYDVFGAGHASTAISAALGIAKARDFRNESHKVVAIVGDGAITAGLAFEGLNNAGSSKTDLLVILNDNRMSISPNVGAVSNYLNKIVLHPGYFELRKKTGNFLRKMGIGEESVSRLSKAEELLRTLATQGLFFESMGFQYFGPIDGHNLDELIPALQNVKDLKCPVLLHIKTEKGKGYEFAEKDIDKFHGMSPFDPVNGSKYVTTTKMTWTDAFANALIRIAEQDKRIVAITAAMKSGTGLNKFEKHFPDRTIDVGIAEQHAVTFAAGMAISGMKPVCAIYSTFLQRAYDQIIHDVCLQNLGVIFALDRAGLVGDDGPTHNGPFDIAYFRAIPNATIMVPKDENELQHMLYTATLLEGPCALRYPRGSGIGAGLDAEFRKLEVGKGEVLQDGNDLLILGIGPILYDAMQIVDELKCRATIINARFAKPLDETLILQYAQKIKNIITIEEGTINGGFGSAVIELLEDHGIKSNVKRIGVPDKFIEHGKPDIQKKLAGIDKESIKKIISEILNNN